MFLLSLVIILGFCFLINVNIDDSGASSTVTSDDGAESFMALYLKDEATFELEVTKYNIDDLSAEREKQGYLCTLEGNYSRAETV
mgnify:CR=1 FL=1